MSAAPRSSARGSRGSDAAAKALQHYADRGVFRGFHATPRRGGGYDYTFRWLSPRALTLRYDPASRTLTFRSLFPNVRARSMLAADLRQVVRDRMSRRVPAHKRLDPRRVPASGAVRRGNFVLSLRIRAGDEAHAISQLLNLVNDLFLVLQERYPEYLVTQLGLSPE